MVNRARQKHDFDLWAYVFMPNHVHLIVHPRTERYSVSSILLSIKQPVARRAIAYLRANKPAALRLLATGQASNPYQFWQKGGEYDRNITSVPVLIEAVHYIHNNPVRKGLIEAPDRWHYSSAPDWDGTGRGPIPIDHDSFPAH